jgi:hypothetical protein
MKTFHKEMLLSPSFLTLYSQTQEPIALSVTFSGLTLFWLHFVQHYPLFICNIIPALQFASSLDTLLGLLVTHG